MAEVAELPQTPQFHMVKKKRRGEIELKCA